MCDSFITYKCHNIKNIKIGTKNLCTKHFNIFFKKKIEYIQKIYKGYYVRKKINNLFINLPRDIQCIVLYYINLPIYYSRYYSSLRKIIYNNSFKLLDVEKKNEKINITYLNKCFKLYQKYHKIIYLNHLKYMYVISNEFVSIANNYLYYFLNIVNFNINYIDPEISELLNISDINTDSIEELLILIHNINTFKKKYENNYNILKINN